MYVIGLLDHLSRLLGAPGFETSQSRVLRQSHTTVLIAGDDVPR
jgi:hypothetical protein